MLTAKCLLDGAISVLKPHVVHPNNLCYQVRVRGVGPSASGDPKMLDLLQLAATGSDVRLHIDDAGGGTVEAMCSRGKLARVVQAAAVLAAGGDEEDVQVVKLEGTAAEGMGVGRKVALKDKITLGQAVEKVKQLCKLDKIRVAVAVGKDLGKFIDNT